ncbi:MULTISPECIES: hypothetical protein [Brevibacterium]|uniref:Uncharacterized protein n=1 Tax=Brevibacterium antiquum CNRZ 918 TaxID=1255637 RepID=A0A2H1JD59_9MICO|nr:MULTISPECIES: hypothetical protein [Brevibacterium]SMX85399.1 hypothetical protein BANT918_01528 [Brevibacterium antiquum CNRZ 918]HCG55052.1 hypothetical protein [Brevibacterium sp.]
MSSHRPWYRTPWVFAACGVGLLLFWFALKWLTNQSDTDAGAGRSHAGTNAADPVGRSDVFWAGPADILFWVAMVLIAMAVSVRIWRLVRRIRS